MTNRVGPAAIRRPLSEADDGPDKKRQNRSTTNTQPLTFSLVHLPVGGPAAPVNSTYTFVNQGPHDFEMGVASTAQKVKKRSLLTPLPVPSPATQSQITFHLYAPQSAAPTPAAAPSQLPAAASSSSSAPLPPLSPAASKQPPNEEKLPVGTIVRELPNGAIMRRYPDGKIELTGKNQVRNVPAKISIQVKIAEMREQLRLAQAQAIREVEERRHRLPPSPPMTGFSSTRHEDVEETDSNSDSEIPSLGELTITDRLPES